MAALTGSPSSFCAAWRPRPGTACASSPRPTSPRPSSCCARAGSRPCPAWASARPGSRPWASPGPLSCCPCTSSTARRPPRWRPWTPWRESAWRWWPAASPPNGCWAGRSSASTSPRPWPRPSSRCFPARPTPWSSSPRSCSRPPRQLGWSRFLTAAGARCSRRAGPWPWSAATRCCWPGWTLPWACSSRRRSSATSTAAGTPRRARSCFRLRLCGPWPRWPWPSPPRFWPGGPSRSHASTAGSSWPQANASRP